jgi:18S rRNA (adenine1779-N6/adenine1780-N6)-dimethyltransferase
MPKNKKERTVSATGPIADKSKGQHFLKNPLVIKGIVDRAAVVPTDTVSQCARASSKLGGAHR